MRRFMNSEGKDENEKRDEDRDEVDRRQGAASVLELLRFLQRERANRAYETDEHQREAGDRDGRRPQQHRAGQYEKHADDNVKYVGWK